MAIVPKSEVFIEMDRQDQLQIVAEAMGDVVEELVYVVQGQKGLSYKGVNLIAFYMGDIGVEPWIDWQQIQMEGQTYWSATVQAYNQRYNLTALGTAEVPEQMEVYDRDEKKQKIPDGRGGFKFHLEFDRFCRRKALSMAQRNAKRAVMPEATIKKWLDYFWDKKQGRDVEPPFKPKAVDADFKVIGTEKKPTPKKTPKKKLKAPEEESPVDPDEESVKATLEANGVDTRSLVIMKYGKKVHIKVQEDYNQVGWVDDHKVITTLLKGVWVSEHDRWEVPPLSPDTLE